MIAVDVVVVTIGQHHHRRRRRRSHKVAIFNTRDYKDKNTQSPAYQNGRIKEHVQSFDNVVENKSTNHNNDSIDNVDKVSLQIEWKRNIVQRYEHWTTATNIPYTNWYNILVLIFTLTYQIYIRK